MAEALEVVLQDRAGYGDGAAELEDWLRRVTSKVASDGRSLSVRLAGDEEVRRWNSQLRGIDRTTDVLSFEGESTPEGRHLGDILVSMPVARRQAREAGHSLERELKELMLHGLLHCLGHDHETDDGEMHSIEVGLREEWIDHE